LLNISETQQQYINNARKGSGLIWTGQAIIPFYDDFPQNTRLYAMMSTNATESLAEAVTSERASRGKKELTEKEKLDEEYEQYQREQSEFYKDRTPSGDSNPFSPSTSFTDNKNPAVSLTEPLAVHLMNDMDDYPDDGFGPDPFALPFSQGGFNDKAPVEDDFFDAKDEEFPDEFDTLFGGGMDSMFNTTPSVKTEPKPAPATHPVQKSAPIAPQPKSAPVKTEPPKVAPQKKSEPPKSNDPTQDALNSFFNI
jgi:hypothetical protein